MTVCGRRLLIVEDEPILRITMGDALRKEGWVVDVAEDGSKGLQLFERHLHDLVLSDLLMPGMDGIELLRRIKAIDSETTVVIITAHGTVDTAVEAMRQGAADFITKPFSMMQLILRLNAVCSFQLLKEQNIRLQEQLEQRYSFGNIIGKSKRMREVFELIKVVADSDASVLVQGESGTGKELVASAILHPGELCIAARVAHRVRAVRLREGRLHGRLRAPCRPLRGGGRRNPLPRRDR
jgi:DNA-binding NtrC family response regulator